MFVLLGSNGQVTSQLARLLLSTGHPVRVVGRSASAMAPLAVAGAEIVVGDCANAEFLADVFDGALGAYVMIPPCYSAPSMRAAQDQIGAAIASALRRARLRRVVNLSSVGAELATGTGPIVGLHAQERRLAGIEGVLHLRPGSFMENLLPAAAVVAAAGVLPGLEAAGATIPVVATRDIAAVAARELIYPHRQGTLILHAPRHVTPRDMAAAVGVAIGQPELPYVQSDPVEAKALLLAEGLSDSAANELLALARWLSTSPLESVRAAPVEVQPTTLEQFAAEVFAPAYAHAIAEKTRAA